ncbi:hypothetical protein CTAYLR_006590 [Chrysophaeum taylorii]|uniref:Tryptophan--tRNA ligase, cytoplasmic n=1 Tax=Chrysophaeum taylorii TaxID=2483200 RepID=A0AAD7XR48_9STRA|nr:hypothetical protein CTAYLR_006590 [Chrysophaeum taylorii]
MAEKKEKKVRPGPPPPPASVNTAGLAVRVAVGKVFGLDPNTSMVGLQPTWVTEAGTGKLTMSLEASRRSPFPKDPAVHEKLLDMLEREVSALCESPVRIAVAETKRYGVVGGVLVESEHPVLASVGRVSLVRGKKAEIVLVGKKRQVTVKFRVDESVTTEEEAPSADEDATALLEASRAKVLEEVVDLDESVAVKEETRKEEEEEMVVDPFQVVGKVDYDKLVSKFGSQVLDGELLARLERCAQGPLHRFLRRGIFFSHRDLHKICECAERGDPFYLYTGRGPSSSAMHLGHLVPFMMTQWLQEAFGVPLVVQMTDDEKFLWKGVYDGSDYNLDYYRGLTRENAKDIVACGFDKDKTFIFSDVEYVGHMYPNIAKIWKSVTYSQVRAAFGFDGQSNIGQSAFPAIQAAPSFSTSFPVPLSNIPNLPLAACLIPCAIDQDPYFRVTRDVAHKLAPSSHKLGGKPALLHSKFFPPLQGAAGKMSSSDENSAVFLTDTPEDIERKIKAHAFSGGRETAKEQRAKGADLDADVSFQWLRFFMEDDDELDRIARSYGSGQGDYWNTAAVKAKLIDVLKDLVATHQHRRAQVSRADLDEWMAIRPLKTPPPRK